jgi:uncharacterized membrane protein YqiK
MPPSLIPVVVAVGVMVIVIAGTALLMRRAYVSVPSGFALIVTRPSREPDVTFSGAVVFPGMNRGELLDIRARTLKIERRQKNPLVTKDGVSLVATATFVVRVNRQTEDVLTVARRLGVDRANDPAIIDELFRPKFEQALEAVAGAMRAEDVLAERMRYQDQVVSVIGMDLNGFHLDDLAIHEVYRADG